MTLLVRAASAKASLSKWRRCKLNVQIAKDTEDQGHRRDKQDKQFAAQAACEPCPACSNYPVCRQVWTFDSSGTSSRNVSISATGSLADSVAKNGQIVDSKSKHEKSKRDDGKE